MSRRQPGQKSLELLPNRELDRELDREWARGTSSCPYDMKRFSMEQILQALDAQWPQMATSPEARRALIRWANDNDVFLGMRDLEDVRQSRRDAAIAQEVQLVVARLAPSDELAARTILQIVLPGLIQIVGRVGHDDPDASDEVVAIAWERIRTYPSSRQGSVSANVVFDVRKRYVKLRRGDTLARLHVLNEVPAATSSTEDHVLAVLQLEEILEACRRGFVSAVAFDAIVRTRVHGESLAAVAASNCMSTAVMCQRRWRAEQRLRSLPLAC
jgi:hypothetical protein